MGKSQAHRPSSSHKAVQILSSDPTLLKAGFIGFDIQNKNETVNLKQESRFNIPFKKLVKKDNALQDILNLVETIALVDNSDEIMPFWISNFEELHYNINSQIKDLSSKITQKLVSCVHHDDFERHQLFQIKCYILTRNITLLKDVDSLNLMKYFNEEFKILRFKNSNFDGVFFLSSLLYAIDQVYTSSLGEEILGIVVDNSTLIDKYETNGVILCLLSQIFCHYLSSFDDLSLKIHHHLEGFETFMNSKLKLWIANLNTSLTRTEDSIWKLYLMVMSQYNNILKEDGGRGISSSDRTFFNNALTEFIVFVTSKAKILDKDQAQILATAFIPFKSILDNYYISSTVDSCSSSTSTSEQEMEMFISGYFDKYNACLNTVMPNLPKHVIMATSSFGGEDQILAIYKSYYNSVEMIICKPFLPVEIRDNVLKMLETFILEHITLLLQQQMKFCKDTWRMETSDSQISTTTIVFKCFAKATANFLTTLKNAIAVDLCNLQIPSSPAPDSDYGSKIVQNILTKLSEPFSNLLALVVQHPQDTSSGGATTTTTTMKASTICLRDFSTELLKAQSESSGHYYNCISKFCVENIGSLLEFIVSNPTSPAGVGYKCVNIEILRYLHLLCWINHELHEKLIKNYKQNEAALLSNYNIFFKSFLGAVTVDINDQKLSGLEQPPLPLLSKVLETFVRAFPSLNTFYTTPTVSVVKKDDESGVRDTSDDVLFTLVADILLSLMDNNNTSFSPIHLQHFIDSLIKTNILLFRAFVDRVWNESGIIKAEFTSTTLLSTKLPRIALSSTSVRCAVFQAVIIYLISYLKDFFAIVQEVVPPSSSSSSVSNTSTILNFDSTAPTQPVAALQQPQIQSNNLVTYFIIRIFQYYHSPPAAEVLTRSATAPEYDKFIGIFQNFLINLKDLPIDIIISSTASAGTEEDTFVEPNQTNLRQKYIEKLRILREILLKNVIKSLLQFHNKNDIETLFLSSHHNLTTKLYLTLFVTDLDFLTTQVLNVRCPELSAVTKQITELWINFFENFNDNSTFTGTTTSSSSFLRVIGQNLSDTILKRNTVNSDFPISIFQNLSNKLLLYVPESSHDEEQVNERFMDFITPDFVIHGGDDKLRKFYEEHLESNLELNMLNYILGTVVNETDSVDHDDNFAGRNVSSLPMQDITYYDPSDSRVLNGSLVLRMTRNHLNLLSFGTYVITFIEFLELYGDNKYSVERSIKFINESSVDDQMIKALSDILTLAFVNSQPFLLPLNENGDSFSSETNDNNIPETSITSSLFHFKMHEFATASSSTSGASTGDEISILINRCFDLSRTFSKTFHKIFAASNDTSNDMFSGKSVPLLRVLVHTKLVKLLRVQPKTLPENLITALEKVSDLSTQQSNDSPIYLVRNFTQYILENVNHFHTSLLSITDDKDEHMAEDVIIKFSLFLTGIRSKIVHNFGSQKNGGNMVIDSITLKALFYPINEFFEYLADWNLNSRHFKNLVNINLSNNNVNHHGFDNGGNDVKNEIDLKLKFVSEFFQTIRSIIQFTHVSIKNIIAKWSLHIYKKYGGLTAVPREFVEQETTIANFEICAFFTRKNWDFLICFLLTINKDIIDMAASLLFVSEDYDPKLRNVNIYAKLVVIRYFELIQTVTQYVQYDPFLREEWCSNLFVNNNPLLHRHIANLFGHNFNRDLKDEFTDFFAPSIFAPMYICFFKADDNGQLSSANKFIGTFLTEMIYLMLARLVYVTSSCDLNCEILLKGEKDLSGSETGAVISVGNGTNDLIDNVSKKDTDNDLLSAINSKRDLYFLTIKRATSFLTKNDFHSSSSRALLQNFSFLTTYNLIQSFENWIESQELNTSNIIAMDAFYDNIADLLLQNIYKSYQQQTSYTKFQNSLPSSIAPSYCNILLLLFISKLSTPGKSNNPNNESQPIKLRILQTTFDDVKNSLRDTSNEAKSKEGGDDIMTGAFPDFSLQPPPLPSDISWKNEGENSSSFTLVDFILEDNLRRLMFWTTTTSNLPPNTFKKWHTYARRWWKSVALPALHSPNLNINMFDVATLASLGKVRIPSQNDDNIPSLFLESHNDTWDTYVENYLIESLLPFSAHPESHRVGKSSDQFFGIFNDTHPNFTFYNDVLLQLFVTFLALRELPTRLRHVWSVSSPNITIPFELSKIDDFNTSLFINPKTKGNLAKVDKFVFDFLKLGEGIVDAELQCISHFFSRPIREERRLDSTNVISPITTTSLSKKKPPGTTSYEAPSTDKKQNFTVKVKRKVREISARYETDDFTIEIEIKIPPNYPLEPVKIECGKRSGISQVQWRTWLLQLNALIIYRDGSILEGLKLWKRNVDRYLNGTVTCMICFSLIDPKEYSLHRNNCPQCKNRYHATCLYKWFRTSHNNTCPLCRYRFFT